MRKTTQLLLAAGVITLFTAAVEAAPVLVYEWFHPHNRVRDVLLIERDEERGLITRVRTFRYTPERRPVSTEELLAEGELIAETRLLEESGETLRYKRDTGSREDEIEFRVSDRSILFQPGEDGSQFSYQINPDRVSADYARDGEKFAELSFEFGSIIYSNSLGDQVFLVDESGTYRAGIWRVKDLQQRTQVTLRQDGSYILETPNYGDPIPFLSRHEVWARPGPRVDLTTAIINGALLPLGAFEYLFPFFAPTPQEVLAAAREGEQGRRAEDRAR
ncbi:MAG: hypothetical protein ACLFP6_09910 [Spirochaetaceae bacterium]